MLNESQMYMVLDYMLNLGRQMLLSGASLERTEDAIYRTCAAYELEDVSIYALNSFLSLSVKNAEGEMAHQQTTIGRCGLQMQRLHQLNQLSRQVCSLTPPPARLTIMLKRACVVQEYSRVQLCLGNLIALLCLCGIFGGGLKELPAVLIIVPVLSVVGWLVNRPEWDVSKMLYELIAAFAAGCISIGWCALVPEANLFTLLITSAFMLIPGIPIINSVRNVMCGNEVNGVIELMKVVLETLTIVGGLVAAVSVFGGI